jgi:hypothetical protein
MKNRSIFKLLSLVGLALGAVGTLLSNWADDKELDMIIDEKLDERLAAHKDEEESEES